MAINFD